MLPYHPPRHAAPALTLQAEESGTKLPADLALGWLKVHFDGEQLAATLSGGDGSGGGGGVQLSAVHREEALELAVTLR